MLIICPQCRNHIEVADDNSAEVLCTSCGSTFRLEHGSTTGWRTFDGRRKLGRFDLIDTLGAGAFGTVYLARDPDLDRTVALKVPRAGKLLTSEDLDRFLREARSVAQLRHPSIVTVHEVGEVDGLPYLVTDVVRGLTLADLLTARRMPIREAAQLVAAIADALHYAHEHGVVHRDVKPSNIMLEDDGTPHLMDFGLAKRDAGEITMTMDGQVLGTPAYMSPEQAVGESHQVDGRSDVYSLGVVLYQLVTGELPFRGNTRMLLHQVRHDEPRPPRSLNDGIPRDLETICLKAMAKEPARRYATARDLADDLRRFLQGEPIQARPVGTWERGWRWVRRRPAVAALLAVSSVAALALVGAAVGYGYSIRLQAAYQSETRARADAEQARGTAEAAQHAEADARAREKAAAAQADLYHYFHRIGLAHAAWRDDNALRAEQLLEECPPAYRHWEWHYLNRLCHKALVTLEVAGRPRMLTMSADGRWLAWACYDGTVRVRDSTTHQEVRSILAHPNDNVNWVAFSPDGKQIASTSRQEVKVWDFKTGQAVFKADTDWARMATFSPDGRRLAVLDKPGITTWDLAKGQKLPFGKGQPAAAKAKPPIEDSKPRPIGRFALAFSPDGKRVATATSYRGVQVWSVADGKPALVLEKAVGTAQAVAFSPDGRQLAAATSGWVAVWDATSGRRTFFLSQSGDPSRSAVVTGVAFSPDSRLLVSAGVGGVRVWEAATGKEICTLLKESPNWPRDVAFSPDGRTLAVGTLKGIIGLWDVARWEETSTISAHRNEVTRLAFSPDGKQLASVTYGEIKVWDPTTGQEGVTLQGRHPYPSSVAFSPDGRHLAAASRAVQKGSEVTVWNAATGQETRILKAEGVAQMGVAFRPDGQLAAAGPTGVTLWDLATGAPKTVVPEEVFGIAPKPVEKPARPGNQKATPTENFHANQVVYSPDGRRLAVAALDQVKVLDLTTWQETPYRPLGKSGSCRWVAFSPDGRFLAGTCGEVVYVWDVVRGRQSTVLKGHTDDVDAIAFSPDGQRLASGSRDRTVRVWDLAAGEELFALKGHQSVVSSLMFHPDGQRLFSQSGSELKVWSTAGIDDGLRLAKGPEIPSQSGGPHHEKVSFSPDAKKLFCIDWWRCWEWDAATGRQSVGDWLPSAPQNELLYLALSPDGRRLAALRNARRDLVLISDADPGGKGVALPGSEGYFACSTFSPDSRRLAAANDFGGVKLWDTAGDREARTIAEPTAGGRVTALAFSPDGERLAFIYLELVSVREETSGQERPALKTWVKLWDVTEGRETAAFRGLTSDCVSFSPDGRRLAAAGAEVKAWDLATGQELFAVPTYPRVECLAFSPDGKRLALGGRDGLKLWDAATGQEVLAMKGHAPALSIAFSPDGQRLAVVGGRNAVMVWAPERPSAETEAVRRQVVAQQAIPWHQALAKESESRKDWFAAAFHLNRLIEAEPKNESYRARLRQALAPPGP